MPEALFPSYDDAPSYTSTSGSRSWPPTLPFSQPPYAPYARARADDDSAFPYAPTPSSRTSYLSPLPLPRLDTSFGLATTPPALAPIGASSWSAPPDYPSGSAYARQPYADSWRSLPPSFPPPTAALPAQSAWLPTTTGISTSPTQAWATRSPVASTSTALRSAEEDDWLLPTARWPTDHDYDWVNGQGRGEPDDY